MTVATITELRLALKSETDIVLADGIYVGQVDIPRDGVTIRAANPWRARLWPAGGYGDCIDMSGRSRVRLSGLSVEGAGTIGVRATDCRECVIEDCRVERCARQGVLMSGERNTVTRCLIQRNGLSPQLDHGLYFSGSYHIVRDNVVRWNASYGIHGYTELVQCCIQGNIVHGHREKSGILVWSGTRNLVIHNQSWGNGVNVDIRNPDPSNLVAGNTDRDLGRWPLVSKTE